MSLLRLAAFQRRPVFGDIPGAKRTLVRDLAWADERGAHLAVFPECYLQGYATDRRTLDERALSLSDPSVADLLLELRGVRAMAVVGMIERRGDALLNTALVIAEGQLIGTYSKAHPNEEGIAAGREFPVFRGLALPFGINICNDANYPETAMRLVSEGARLICYPLNNMLQPHKARKWRLLSVDNLRTRAIQTGCWVASSDVVGDHERLTSFGCTMIIRPDGQIAARVAEGTEGVALFDLR